VPIWRSPGRIRLAMAATRKRILCAALHEGPVHPSLEAMRRWLGGTGAGLGHNERAAIQRCCTPRCRTFAAQPTRGCRRNSPPTIFDSAIATN
jgi:hypothetical protein